MRFLLISLVLASAVTSRSVSVAAQEVMRSSDLLILATNRVQSSGPSTTADFKAGQTGPLKLFLLGNAEPGSGIPTTPVTREALARQLAKRSGSGEVLLYVHGFSNTVDYAVGLGSQVAHKMRFPGSIIVFSWPSLGSTSPMAYLTDVRTALGSVDPMHELLELLRETQAVSRLHVLAHSLGNELVMKAMLKLAPEGGRKLGEVIFCAPDVVRTEFTASFSHIRRIVRGATLWGSNSDMALRLAQRLGRPNRAGLFNRGPLVLSGLDTIDVSAETSVFWIDHDPYRQSDSLFADLEFLLKEQRMPPWERDGRKSSYKREATPDGPYWRFKEAG